MAKMFIAACDDAGIDVIITSTYRDIESQNALFAQGRTKPGKKVTNAKGGQSLHNYQLALDFCPIVNGKAAWNDIALFERCGVIAEMLGFEWAGRWKRFKEYAHIQYTEGHDLTYFQSGGKLT
jgi:peptidoglycan L-alanyl-D-glutamate endopeptidase CwlK